MPASAAPAATTPPPPRRQQPRRRVYAAVDPWCEWASTEHDDTLVVDVSGFRKEELRVLYSTNRKLKVTGERQVDGGARWARFVKVFPVPRSCDAGAIRARMDLESARLSVVLPKRSPPPSSSASYKDKKNGHEPVGEHAGQASAGSSSGSPYSAKEEDAGTGKFEAKEQRAEQGMEEQQRPEATAAQDAAEIGGDDKGESKKWWRKIRVVHVLGFVLVLALVGVGATLLYVMLL